VSLHRRSLPSIGSKSGRQSSEGTTARLVVTPKTACLVRLSHVPEVRTRLPSMFASTNRRPKVVDNQPTMKPDCRQV
jgi:hypothetical protein